VVGRLYDTCEGAKVKAVFTQIWQQIFVKEKIMVIIIWSKFWSINEFILQNWGACVDIVFWIQVRMIKKDQLAMGRLLYWVSRGVPMGSAEKGWCR